MSTPAWMDHALCTTRENRGLPWTTDAIETPTVLVELMQETCEACPVLLACEAYATRNDVTGGWWGGVDRAPAPEDLLDLLDVVPAAPLRGAA
ncbi:WhiB family transcriptional regulator [Nocardioides sp. NBC_00850]|uniref:WhiB family transcriptional regulator n=1 Tax=Nocardioides sp. NBC_00850 TaxID=2976001 RepID=UPI00386809EF|nr:WhiB family transcriptional regulator [Nocardioides sp. NBC_00850]